MRQKNEESSGTSQRKPNRKKWCKGKVGVEHKPIVKHGSQLSNVRFHRDTDYFQICENCDKILAERICPSCYCPDKKLLFMEDRKSRFECLACNHKW